MLSNFGVGIAGPSAPRHLASLTEFRAGLVSSQIPQPSLSEVFGGGATSIAQSSQQPSPSNPLFGTRTTSVLGRGAEATAANPPVLAQEQPTSSSSVFGGFRGAQQQQQQPASSSSAFGGVGQDDAVAATLPLTQQHPPMFGRGIGVTATLSLPEQSVLLGPSGGTANMFGGFGGTATPTTLWPMPNTAGATSTENKSDFSSIFMKLVIASCNESPDVFYAVVVVCTSNAATSTHSQLSKKMRLSTLPFHITCRFLTH